MPKTTFRLQKRILITTLAFVACSAMASFALAPPKRAARVIGHRGASGYAPENTMAAFRKAHELGAEMIELDVYHTLDGEIVVIHDDDVNRTTGAVNRVTLMSAKEVAKLDAGSWMSEKFAGERVPTLRETLEWAKDKIEVNIEIKGAGCEEGIVRLVEEFDMVEKVIVSSFHHEYLKKIKELNPKIRTGALVRDVVQNGELDEIIKNCAPDAVNPRYLMVTKSLVRAAHKRGLAVNVYTVNDPITMRRLAKYGVDGIITNYPDLLRKVLKKMKHKKSKKVKGKEGGSSK